MNGYRVKSGKFFLLAAAITLSVVAGAAAGAAETPAEPVTGEAEIEMRLLSPDYFRVMVWLAIAERTGRRPEDIVAEELAALGPEQIAELIRQTVREAVENEVRNIVFDQFRQTGEEIMRQTIRRQIMAVINSEAAVQARQEVSRIPLNDIRAWTWQEYHRIMEGEDPTLENTVRRAVMGTLTREAFTLIQQELAAEIRERIRPLASERLAGLSEEEIDALVQRVIRTARPAAPRTPERE